MLNILRASLKSLDDSFMLSYKQVKNETEKLNTALNNLNIDHSTSKLSKSEVTEIANRIEKLSIKNEYKLSLLKDFPEYFNSIKYKKK